jgi:hypothetical protein
VVTHEGTRVVNCTLGSGALVEVDGDRAAVRLL